MALREWPGRDKYSTESHSDKMSDFIDRCGTIGCDYDNDGIVVASLET